MSRRVVILAVLPERGARALSNLLGVVAEDIDFLSSRPVQWGTLSNARREIDRVLGELPEDRDLTGIVVLCKSGV